mmetsp:Transcript_25540/g.29238  ORF Transcript_25540/g.29238 Transcript_25540/m.29238 type:complete len:120 (-) Transcript_25540:35-394(-)
MSTVEKLPRLPISSDDSHFSHPKSFSQGGRAHTPMLWQPGDSQKWISRTQMASSASVREFRTPKVNRMQDSPRRSQTLTTSRPEVEINQWQQMQEMETLKLDALMSPRLGRIKAYSCAY